MPPGLGQPMRDLILALGLVMVLEGLVYGLFPRQLKEMVVRLLNLPEERLK